VDQGVLGFSDFLTVQPHNSVDGTKKFAHNIASSISAISVYVCVCVCVCVCVIFLIQFGIH
jgi:hypothetical protein